MRLGHLVLVSSLILGSAASALAVTHSRRGPTYTRVVSKRVVVVKSKPLVGQRAIDDERATQIQTSLIRLGYLTGAPSGHWDTDTEAAMERLQAENGWQTKLVPDSRAIIKLGLGPASPASSSSQSSQRNAFSQE